MVKTIKGIEKVIEMKGKNEKKELENLRKIRAYSILAKGDTPEKIDEETFILPSQSNPEKTYTVLHKRVWKCDCPDYQHYHGELKCKHIQAVEMWLNLRNTLLNYDDTLDIAEEMQSQIKCDCGSYDVIKSGMKKNKHGNKQRYRCKSCGKRFILDKVKGHKVNGKLIALSMDLYFKGMSYRKIADTIFQFYDIKLHHETVRRWVNKFMKKIRDYTDKIEPNLGDIWHVDECVIKTPDERKIWNYNIMDRKTRFLITNHMENGRHLQETTQVFKKAMNTYDIPPEVVITDGLTSYPYAIKHTFGRNVKHIKNAGLSKRQNNNLIERYHGTWRHREKVMRGHGDRIPTEELLDNFRTYYNFIRGHDALDGHTPPEMAGIDLNLGKNKWVGLLEKSL